MHLCLKVWSTLNLSDSIMASPRHMFSRRSAFPVCRAYILSFAKISGFWACNLGWCFYHIFVIICFVSSSTFFSPLSMAIMWSSYLSSAVKVVSTLASSSDDSATVMLSRKSLYWVSSSSDDLLHFPHLLGVDLWSHIFWDIFLWLEAGPSPRRTWPHSSAFLASSEAVVPSSIFCRLWRIIFFL